MIYRVPPHDRGLPPARLHPSAGRDRDPARPPRGLSAGGRLEKERGDVIPGAESMESLASRVRAGIEAIVAATGPGARAAAFLHGGVIGEACRQAAGSRSFAFVHGDNGSISRLVVF